MPASVEHHVSQGTAQPKLLQGQHECTSQGLGGALAPEASCQLTLSGVKRDLTPKLMQPMRACCLGEEQRVSLPLSVQGSLLSNVPQSTCGFLRAPPPASVPLSFPLCEVVQEFYSVSRGRHQASLVPFPRSQNSS